MENYSDKDLGELMQTSGDIIDRLAGDRSFAALVIGVRSMEDPETKQLGVLTTTAAAGLYALLEEGLYAELASNIEEGNKDLFITLRNVVNALQEDFDIDEDADYEPTNLH